MSHGDKAAALQRFGEYVNPMKLRTLRHAGLDVLEARREGARVWDEDGRSFIDCVTAAGCFNIGRRNPQVVARLQAALAELDIGTFLLCSRPRADLAERLAALLPGDLHFTMFGASGGEVVDFALKLARGYTRRPGVVSAQRAYHGHTGFALSAIGRPQYREPFEPLLGHFARVSFGDLEAMAAAIGPETAAVILEPIQGEGGIRIPPPGYIAGVRRLCDERGALLILDEIQTGFGRTGRLWACDHEGVVPDIITLGKSLGGGLYPITAACFREPLGDFLVAHPFIHLSTFGGSDLGCVVGLATLDYISEHDLPGHAQRMGERFAAGFDDLLTRHGTVLRQVRQRGLMMGLQFSDDSHGPRMSYELGRRGVLGIFTGNDPSVMRLQPALVITPDEVDEVLAALDGALGALAVPAAAGDGIAVARVRRRPLVTE